MRSAVFIGAALALAAIPPEDPEPGEAVVDLEQLTAEVERRLARFDTRAMAVEACREAGELPIGAALDNLERELREELIRGLVRLVIAERRGQVAPRPAEAAPLARPTESHVVPQHHPSPKTLRRRERLAARAAALRSSS